MNILKPSTSANSEIHMTRVTGQKGGDILELIETLKIKIQDHIDFLDKLKTSYQIARTDAPINEEIRTLLWVLELINILEKEGEQE